MHAEFVQLVSAQANTNKQATIQPQHVIDALEQLEFSELSTEIAVQWKDFQAGTATRGAHAALPSLLKLIVFEMLTLIGHT